MLFNSFQFWMIYPLLFSFFWMIPSKRASLRKWYLIVVSYILYMNWNVGYSLILFAITISTYCGGLVFASDKYRDKKNLMLFFMVVVLLPLFILNFSYFMEWNNFSLRELGISFRRKLVVWILPHSILAKPPVCSQKSYMPWELPPGWQGSPRRNDALNVQIVLCPVLPGHRKQRIMPFRLNMTTSKTLGQSSICIFSDPFPAWHEDHRETGAPHHEVPALQGKIPVQPV